MAKSKRWVLPHPLFETHVIFHQENSSNNITQPNNNLHPRQVVTCLRAERTEGAIGVSLSHPRPLDGTKPPNSMPDRTANDLPTVWWFGGINVGWSGHVTGLPENGSEEVQVFGELRVERVRWHRLAPRTSASRRGERWVRPSIGFRVERTSGSPAGHLFLLGKCITQNHVKPCYIYIIYIHFFFFEK